MLEIGCGDGGCLVEKPKGMHTNSGCKCGDRPAVARNAFRYLNGKIRKLKEENEELKYMFEVLKVVKGEKC